MQLIGVVSSWSRHILSTHSVVWHHSGKMEGFTGRSRPFRLLPVYQEAEITSSDEFRTFKYTPKISCLSNYLDLYEKWTFYGTNELKPCGQHFNVWNLEVWASPDITDDNIIHLINSKNMWAPSNQTKCPVGVCVTGGLYLKTHITF